MTVGPIDCDEECVPTPTIGGLRLDTLYRSYWTEICRYVAKTFGAGPPDPEDVAQTAFANLCSTKAGNQIDNPRAFLYRAAHNIVISHYRKASTRRQYIADQEVIPRGAHQDELHPERIALSRERLALLEQAMWKMPVKRRRMMIMHRFDGLSYAEISRRTGLSQTVVRKHVAKALADFQLALDEVEVSQVENRQGKENTNTISTGGGKE